MSHADIVVVDDDNDDESCALLGRWLLSRMLHLTSPVKNEMKL